MTVAFVLFCLLEWQKAKTVLFELLLQVKWKAKDAILNSGQTQEEWVVKKAYQYLPLKFKIFLSEERLRIIVHKLYHLAKDKMDDGKLNNSI